MYWTSPPGKLPILWSFRHVCWWAASFSAQAILPVYQYSAGRWDAMKVWIRCLDWFWRNMCRPDFMNWLIDCVRYTLSEHAPFGRTYFFLEASASSQQCPFRSHSPVLITSDYTKSSVRFGNPINMSPQHCYSGSDMWKDINLERNIFSTHSGVETNVFSQRLPKHSLFGSVQFWNSRLVANIFSKQFGFWHPTSYSIKTVRFGHVPSSHNTPVWEANI